MKSKSDRPPIIDLDALSKPTGIVFKTREEELDSAFLDAAWWIGVVMSIEDFRNFIWSPEREADSDVSIINADKFDKNRR